VLQLPACSSQAFCLLAEEARFEITVGAKVTGHKHQTRNFARDWQREATNQLRELRNLPREPSLQLRRPRLRKRKPVHQLRRPRLRKRKRRLQLRRPRLQQRILRRQKHLQRSKM